MLRSQTRKGPEYSGAFLYFDSDHTNIIHKSGGFILSAHLAGRKTSFAEDILQVEMNGLV